MCYSGLRGDTCVSPGQVMRCNDDGRDGGEPTLTKAKLEMRSSQVPSIAASAAAAAAAINLEFWKAWKSGGQRRFGASTPHVIVALA